MHGMGKVGVWLIVFAGIGASVLTSKLIRVRDGWTKKFVAARDEFRKLKPQIIDKQLELSAKEGERFRSLELWGTSTAPVQTQVQPNGSLVADLGTDQGLSEGKVIYGFEIQPDNTVIYRGDFTVAAARNNQSQLVPNWGVRSDDVATWKNGMWRWRNQVPSAFQANFDHQIRVVSETAAALADRRRSVEVQGNLLTQAEEQLSLREAELVGGEQLSKEAGVEIEFREGLVAAIESVEEKRNQILTKVDGLRRQLRAVQNEVDRLQQQNVELTKKLPKPDSESTLSQQ